MSIGDPSVGDLSTTIQSSVFSGPTQRSLTIEVAILVAGEEVSSITYENMSFLISMCKTATHCSHEDCISLASSSFAATFNQIGPMLASSEVSYTLEITDSVCIGQYEFT